MAVDYNKYSNKDDFTGKLAAANIQYYPTGKTGYENYYIDILSQWRELYDPSVTEEEFNKLFPDGEIDFNNTDNMLQQKINTLETNIKNLNKTIQNLKEQLQGISDEDIDAKAEKEQAILVAQLEIIEKQSELEKTIIEQQQVYKYQTYYYTGEYKHWNKNVYLAPQNLNFWFDFLDTEGELSKYSVKSVGCRPKAINDSNVKAIYFREIPNVLFTTNYEEDSSKNQGYTYISINPALMNTMFSISSQSKSAKGAIDELLYQHSYCVASATINTVPIYYLEPNSRIHIVDKNSNLEGYYNISKFSIPLKYNGIMSITATKAAETI